ncbi:MAG: homoserine dehydrogenase [Clostridiales bacterium]|nr:homoserine dehydrogenase [Clostridiales bacterium]
MINIAIFGFGVVGSGTAEVLTQNAQLIADRVGEQLNIKYILDLREFPDSPFADKIVHDIDVILNDPEVKICAELMGGAHPAFEFTERAMKAGKSVVTSNKEVVATFGPELLKIAAENNVRYLFEASVGGGIPVIHPIGSCLTANDITEVDGILNGTTNYILTQMIGGKDFEAALAEAQEKGYAERNPSADVDGIDTCRKVAILSAIAFGKLVPPDKIQTEGIRNVTLKDVEIAEKLGAAIKLIGRTVRVEDKICACVAPMLVKCSNPLANISDVYNGILVNGNAIGDVMFYGRGAGKLPTASAVVSDIIEIATYLDHPHSFHVWERLSDDDILPAERLKSRFYLRFDKKPNHCLCMLDAEVIEDSEDCYAVVTGEVSPLEIGITLSENYTAMRLL